LPSKALTFCRTRRQYTDRLSYFMAAVRAARRATFRRRSNRLRRYRRTAGVETPPLVLFCLSDRPATTQRACVCGKRGSLKKFVTCRLQLPLSSLVTIGTPSASACVLACPVNVNHDGEREASSRWTRHR
jgi:hypothetical protein